MKIDVTLKGRLGNQLFIYATARALQEKMGAEKLSIDLASVFKVGYQNSLTNYELIPNIEFYDSREQNKNYRFVNHQLLRIYCMAGAKLNYRSLYEFEKKSARLYHSNGLYLCQNGYLDFKAKPKKDIYMNGYFQSYKYFAEIKDKLKKELTPKSPIMECNRAFVGKLESEPESVCVDIRLGDYMNNPLHGVCTVEYYRKAIDYLGKKLKNPVFYVFSDDIETVTKALNTSYPLVFEDGKSPDYEKLRMMSKCKHFVISNSSYSWWAQYMSENPDKLVIAPNKWFKQDVPCDIYMDNWTLIEV